MNNKIYAILAAALMIAVAGIVIFDNEDSDASVSTTGQFKVNYYDGSNWSNSTVNAFDGRIAVKTAMTNLSVPITINENWQDSSAGYSNPNINYGVVSSVDGSEDFCIYVYINNSWAPAANSLGWYKSFQDYANTVTFEDGSCAGTANIAIIKGTVAPSAEGKTLNDLTTIDLTQITNTSDFRYNFTLKDEKKTVAVPFNFKVKVIENSVEKTISLKNPDLQSGITIVGYGSDMYLALKDALKSKAGSVDGGEKVFEQIQESGYSYYKYYSWINTILNKGTSSTTEVVPGGTETTYTYWVSTIGSTETLYTLGYYSKLSGTYNDADSINLTYKDTTPWFTPNP